MAGVQVHGLTKTFDKGRITAVRNVSFSVDRGELFGLIGPDGSGKTTAFRMLTTLMVPDSGTARVNGFDVVTDYDSIRQCVGYMPGRFSLYQDLTVEENLTFFATLFNTTIDENYDLIKAIYQQLAPFKDRRAGKLSGGMKQKLALCCALIHKPSVLLLDEPTTGVDVVSRKEFWSMLKSLKEQGITILVSTPYMDEAKLCDRIALIQEGTIMSVDSPDSIVRKFPRKLFAVKANDIYLLSQRLKNEDDIESCHAFGEYLHVTLKKDDPTENKLELIAGGDAMEGLEVRTIAPTVEDCFIRLMTQDFLNAKSHA